MTSVDPDEGTSYVTCRLCGRRFRTINQEHLIAKHGWDSDHPVLEYRQRYGLKSSWCHEAHAKCRSRKVEAWKRKGQWWTRARVVREIRARHSSGRPLNYDAVKRDHAALISAALDRFPSWDRALSAAGLDPAAIRMTRPFDQGKVIEAIRELRRQGHPLNYRAVFLRDWSLTGAARNYFGGWDPALRAAGVDPRTVRCRPLPMTRSEVLEGLRALSKPISTNEAHRRHRRLFEWSCRHFGTWVRALNEAGFEYRPHQCQVILTRERIVSLVQERARAGKSIAPRDIAREVPGIWKGIRREFDGWKQAYQAAGFEYRPYQCRLKWTRERIVSLIQERRRAGKPITPGVVRREEGAVWKGVIREFEGWERALRAAGVPQTEIDDAMALSRKMSEGARR